MCMLLLISRFTNNTSIKKFDKSLTWRYWLNLVRQTLVPCSLLHFNFYMFCHNKFSALKTFEPWKKIWWYKTKICRKERKHCLHVALTPLLLPLLFLYPQCLLQLYQQQDLPSHSWTTLEVPSKKEEGWTSFLPSLVAQACMPYLLQWNASHNLISHINFISPVQAYDWSRWFAISSPSFSFMGEDGKNK